jgi:hypothetical protein
MGELTLGLNKIKERICMPCGNGCADCINEMLCYRCDLNKYHSALNPSMCVTDCTNLPATWGTPQY